MDNTYEMKTTQNQQIQKEKWNHNYFMVVIGQIISLFGNAILRFALPLYLLNQTGSAALFGMVSACAFIPMVVLAPVGGILADRVNKRNIMVILDFATAALTVAVSLLLGKISLVGLLLVALFLLYGISGTYQPAVQASIPALLKEDQIMKGNAVINLVSSFASLIGPVIGGILFATYGIRPILYVSVICFIASAVMEIFIKIPYVKKPASGNIFAIGLNDLRESFSYMGKEQPLIFKFSLAIAAVNMILSALVIIGLPVIITQRLGFDSETANTLYGYSQGAIALGSLFGGMGVGMLSGKLKARDGYRILFWDALTLIPMGIAIMLPIPRMVSYVIILVSCFVMMFFAAVFSIQIMSYLQMIVPGHLIGKIISCAMCIGMCASPIGQAIYGALFEKVKDRTFVIFFVATALTALVALGLKKSCRKLEEMLDVKCKKVFSI